MLPAANDSDGGGSIRIPAAMCGLVGLKPSRGRVSMGPVKEEWGVSVQHVVCHTMRDCAAILDATAIPFLGDGVIAPDHGRTEARAVEARLQHLRKAGGRFRRARAAREFGDAAGLGGAAEQKMVLSTAGVAGP